MKNLMTAATVATFAIIASNVSFAQCRISGGPVSRPAHRPQPVVVHKTYHHVSKRGGSVKPAPAAYQPAHAAQPSPPVATSTATPLTQVAVGQRVEIDGRRFGHSPGSVTLRINQMIWQTQLAGWGGNKAVAILPRLEITEPTRATVVVNTVMGKTAAELDVVLLPAAPEAQPVQPTVVNPGQTITVDGTNLGAARGQIQLQISGITLVANVSMWNDATVTATLPNMQLTEPVEAKLNIVRSDGTVADSLVVVLSTHGQNVASR